MQEKDLSQLKEMARKERGLSLANEGLFRSQEQLGRLNCECRILPDDGDGVFLEYVNGRVGVYDSPWFIKNAGRRSIAARRWCMNRR